MAPLGEHGRLLDVVAVDQPAVDIAARLWGFAGLSGNLIGRRPRDPWAQQHRRAGYDDAVLRAVATFRPDVVLVRSTFAHMVPGIRSSVARVVIDAHDSDAIYAGMLEGTARPWQRPGLRLRRLNAIRAERTFGQAYEPRAPARRELDYFRRRRPGLSCLLAPNGVPVPAVAPARDPDGRTLLLFGAFGLPMNLAAADALVDRVLPAVLAACPRCRSPVLPGPACRKPGSGDGGTSRSTGSGSSTISVRSWPAHRRSSSSRRRCSDRERR